MKNLVIYRIISYILLFVAAFLFFSVVTSLLAALANPVALLPVFLVACVIIYTYYSWRFLMRGIYKGIPSKPFVRDLIKVNAYVTLALAAVWLFAATVVLIRPEMISTIIEQVKAAQPAGSPITDEELQKGTHYGIIVVMVYSILLVIHIIITLRLLRRYPQLFQEPAN